jgi:transposase
MPRRARRTFTEEFKAQAVNVVKTSGKPVSVVAKELDLSVNSLREWVLRAEAGEPKKPLELSERAELEQLRKDFQRVKMERDFLKKAAAFFAKESK